MENFNSTLKYSSKHRYGATKCSHKAKYSGMQALGTILGTELMHLTTYQQKTHKISAVVCQSTADLLQRSCDVVQRVYGHDTEDSSSDKIINIGVSLDGSWLTIPHYTLGKTVHFKI